MENLVKNVTEMYQTVLQLETLKRQIEDYDAQVKQVDEEISKSESDRKTFNFLSEFRFKLLSKRGDLITKVNRLCGDFRYNIDVVNEMEVSHLVLNRKRVSPPQPKSID